MMEIHPAWKVCIGLAIVLFVAIATGSRVLIMQHNDIESNEILLDEIQAQQRRGEERAYVARAISCVDIINDGEIEITDECVSPRVVVYYPPSICAKLPAPVRGCGDRTNVVGGIRVP